MSSPTKKVIILGAGGRDFHNFNMFFRSDPRYEVVAFTATQIPYIDDKRYPSSLAGPLYPNGIPIINEDRFDYYTWAYKIDIAVFSYSDVSNQYVMDKASDVMRRGLDFWLLGPKSTMLKSDKPVISVCAVRTGCGKSPTTRRVLEILKGLGKKAVAVRHPMAYGDLAKQAVQRFETIEDIENANCTIEEREEYEPLVKKGFVVYAGVDYEKILRRAEQEADVIVWDGGNNDFPFIKSNLEIVVTDIYRFGHGFNYFPGNVNLKRADVVIINKVDPIIYRNGEYEYIEDEIRYVNPGVSMVFAESVITELPPWTANKKAVVVEDGPTVTHGDMSIGAAYKAARRAGMKVVAPRPYSVGDIKDAYVKYSHMLEVVPALGYSEQQIKNLKETLEKVPAPYIVYATPVDLTRIIDIPKKRFFKIDYEIEVIDTDLLERTIMGRLQ